MATAAKLVLPIRTFLAYLVPLDMDVVPIKFHQFSVWRVTCYDHFCVFRCFFSILVVSMATAAILKKATLKGTTSHGI